MADTHRHRQYTHKSKRKQRKTEAKDGRRKPPGHPQEPKIARVHLALALTWDRETYKPIVLDDNMHLVVAERTAREVGLAMLANAELILLWVNDLNPSKKGEDEA